MSETPGSPDLSTVDAAELARLAATAGDAELSQAMAAEASRRATLDEVFRRMVEHVEPARAAGVSAVIHWKILDRPGGGYDHYEVVLDDGACVVSERPLAEPRVTFEVKPVDFLRLVSGAMSGPVMFMSGKLRIEGDLMFASQVATFFRIPKAG